MPHAYAKCNKNILPCKTPKIVTWRTAASVTLRTCILMIPVVSLSNASHWNGVWIAYTPCFYSNHVSSTAVKSNVTPITNQPPDSIRTWWSDSSTLRTASLQNNSCAQPQDQPLGRCWDAKERTRSEQKAVSPDRQPERSTYAWAHAEGSCITDRRAHEGADIGVGRYFMQWPDGMSRNKPDTMSLEIGQWAQAIVFAWHMCLFYVGRPLYNTA